MGWSRVDCVMINELVKGGPSNSDWSKVGCFILDKLDKDPHIQGWSGIKHISRCVSIYKLSVLTMLSDEACKYYSFMPVLGNDPNSLHE